MADSYSIKALLSAKDNGFSTTLKSALGATKSLGSTIKSGLGFGILQGVGQAAFQSIKGSVSDLMGEMSSNQAAWKTFDGNMKILEKSESYISSSKKAMQQFATETIYNASDMATTFSILESVGTKGTKELVTGFGGLAAAAENPKQAMKSLSTQATQMAAKPKVAWQDYKIMMEQSSAGMAEVAKEMGMSAQELTAKVQAGQVKTEDFFEAIKKVGNSDGFQKLARQYKTTDEAMGGLKETLSNQLEPAFNVLSEKAIRGIEGIINVISKIDAQGLADKISAFADKVGKYWTALKEAFSGVGTALGSAFSAIKKAMSGISGAFGSTESVGNFKSVMEDVANVIKKVAAFAEKHAGAIAKFVQWLPKIALGVVGGVGAFKAFNFVKSFNPFGLFKKNAEDGMNGATNAVKKGKSTVAQVINSIGGVFKNIGTALKSAFSGIGKTFQGIGKALQSTFTGIGKALQGAFKGLGSMLKMANPVNLLALGAAIGIVIAALTLLATQGDGVAKIFEGIGNAVSSVVGAIGDVAAVIIDALANALVTLAPVLPIISQSLVMLSPLVTALGNAFSQVATAIGSAVSQIISALTPVLEIISTTVTSVAEILGNTVSKIVETIGNTIAKIAEIIAPYIPTITACFERIATVIANAITTIVTVVAPYLPCIQGMVEATSQAIQSICQAFTTLVQQIEPVIRSVTDLVKQLGDSISQILQGVADVVRSVGDTISQIFESIGNAISKVIDSIAGVFDSLGQAALNVGKGFKLLAEGIKTVTDLPLLDMGASLGAVATGIAGITAVSGGLDSAGLGMLQLGIGLQKVAETGTRAAAALPIISSVFTSLPAPLQAAAQAMVIFAPAFAQVATVSVLFAKGMLIIASALPAVVTGITSLAAGTTMLSSNMATVTPLFISFASVLPQISATVMMIATAFMTLATNTTAATTALTILTTAFTSMLAGLKIATVTITAFGSNMLSACSGVTAMSTALKAVSSQMKTISNIAKSVESSLKGMQKSINIVQSALDALGSKAKSVMNAVIQVFNNTANKAKSSGQKVAKGFTDGMKNGLKSAPILARTIISNVISIFNAGKSQAYQSGYYISYGFALGMEACLSRVRNAANKIVKEANKAIEAKAKIASPSKVTKKLGGFYGEGFVIGISNMISEAQKAAKELVSIPQVNTPNFAMAYSGEISSDYEYYRNTEYTIVVPIEYDGREVARVTAPYTERELNELQRKQNRKKGNR